MERRIRWQFAIALLAAIGCTRPSNDELGKWIEAKAIPLRTSDPRAPLDDLEPLRGLIGNATVAGLGEATHGTSDFFRMKHRIFEYLVERMGFTVFAIEANLPEAFAVNDYVLTGKGDPKAALHGLYFWTWDTTEVLDLIEWMRRWNADPRHVMKLKFYGVDMQFTPVAARNVITALPAGDPARAALEPLTLKRRLTAEEREIASRAIERIVPQLKDDVVQRNAIVLRQAMQMTDHRSARDEAMAGNLLWIRQREPGAKIAVWAHNGHISRDSKYRPMGWHLAGALGQSYVPLGFAFGEGRFRARQIGHARLPLHTFTVPLNDPGTLDGELARHGPPMFIIDMRTAPPGVVRRLVKGMPIRFAGSTYGPMMMSAQYSQGDFALLLFIRNTTESHPVQRPTASSSSSSSRRQMSASSTSIFACGIAIRTPFAISTSAELRRYSLTCVRPASPHPAARAIVPTFVSVSSSCARMSPACIVSCPTMLDVPEMKSVSPNTVARANDGLRRPYCRG